MVIDYKSPEQIEKMRRTGRAARSVISAMMASAKPGISTLDLDQIAADALARAGAVSTCRHYPTYKAGEGFPGHTCVNVNRVVMHGVPSEYVLRSGDIVGFEVCASLDGWCANAAMTIPVGDVDPAIVHFLKTGAQALSCAVRQVRPDTTWIPIARQIQQIIEEQGYGVIREFVGHGIGRKPNELPMVPNFMGKPTQDFRLRPGMTFTIQPMLTMGKRDIMIHDDQWSIITADGLPGAHFCHTVAVTRDGFDILTAAEPAGHSA